MKVYVLHLQYFDDDMNAWNSMVPLIGSSIDECKKNAFETLGIPLGNWSNQSSDGRTWVKIDRDGLMITIEDRDIGIAEYDFHDEIMRAIVKAAVNDA